jgi:hypothetical protein
MLGSSFYSLTGTVQAYTQQFQNTYNPSTHAIGYQWPQIYAGAGGASAPAYGTDYFGTANSTNWKDPYTEQWSLSVDHDLGSGYAMRLSYIGSETHQLVWAPDENTLPYSTTVSAFNAPISSRCSPTGAASTPVLLEPTRATTPCRRRRAIACSVVWNTTPTLPGPKHLPTTRAVRNRLWRRRWRSARNLNPEPPRRLRQCVRNAPPALEHDSSL